MSYCLIDTNIFIDANRGMAPASEFLSNLDNINISVITAFELLKGARDKKTMEKVKKGIDKFEIIYLTDYIQKNSLEIYYKNKLKQGIGIFDSIIAATAASNNLTLITKNIKHYKDIKGLQIKIPY